MRRLSLAALLLAALALPGAARAYGWPLKPFDRPHPVVGNLDDPRYGKQETSFHFGIDIAAPGWTPVYAVAPGHVQLGPVRVSVISRDRREFAYWHVVALVQQHQEVKLHQLLGWVNPREAHVHLTELWKGHYLNPLRPGGIAPYFDHTRPRIVSVKVDRHGLPVDLQHVSGVVCLITEAYDTPSLPTWGPWANSRVTPALIRWRLIGVTPWRTAVDFRHEKLQASRFNAIYAPGTGQNLKFLPGRYRFYLDRQFYSPVFHNGYYRLEVRVSDIRGNSETSVLPFRIDNL